MALKAHHTSRFQKICVVLGPVDIVTTEASYAVRVHRTCHKVVPLHPILVPGPIREMSERRFAELRNRRDLLLPSQYRPLLGGSRSQRAREISVPTAEPQTLLNEFVPWAGPEMIGRTDCGNTNPNTLLWVARFAWPRKSALGRYAVRARLIPVEAADTCSSGLRTAGYLSSACWTAWPTVKGGGSYAAVGREPIVAARIAQPSDNSLQRRPAVTAMLFERVLTWALALGLSSWLPRVLEDQPDGSGRATQ